jgi:hypothetical protein
MSVDQTHNMRWTLWLSEDARLELGEWLVLSNLDNLSFAPVLILWAGLVRLVWMLSR